MAHDGSLASQVEAWIVAQLATLTPFSDGNVEVFQGSLQQQGAKIIDEFLARRSPFALVAFEQDQSRPLEEGQQAYDPTYGIYIVVRNERPGVSRTGETDGATVTYGTNGIRDLMRNVLHDAEPNFGANGFWAERAEFRGVSVVYQRKDAFMLRAVVVVRETPAA